MNRTVPSFILNAGLVLIGILTALPLIWMVSASLSPMGAASTFPIRLIPETFSAEHYETLFTNLQLGTYFLNSALLAISVTAISLLVNSLAGYAFAKLRFKARDRMFRVLLTALVIPAQVTMLPLFLMLNKLGLVNTYWGVIIPGLASVYGIFLIRQFALSIPDSFIEAARMDGASDFRIYWRLILPLCKPVLATLGIFTFMGTWNDFLWPLIIMTDDSMYTLPVALATLSLEHVQDTELMMAGSVLTVIPVILVFAAVQRYYIQGIMMGGVKG